MEQRKWAMIAGTLLRCKKENFPEKDCALTACCGVCDKFYPCLFGLLDQMKEQADNNVKKQFGDIKLE